MKSIPAFLKTRPVMVGALILVALLVVLLLRGCARTGPAPKPEAAKTFVHEREEAKVAPLLGKMPDAPVLQTNPPGVQLPRLTQYGVDRVVKTNLTANYLPMGKLIPCVTVFAVESSAAGGPIIAMVSEDVAHLGSIVVPKGSQVHGWAQTGRVRDRVLSQNSWTLVWPTGEELALSALALDADRRAEGSWGPSDGVLGLRGKLMKSDHWAELKILGATLLSGAADTLSGRESTLVGSQVAPSLANAGLQGSGRVIDYYAQELYRRMETEGWLVHVAAAKSFYLYTLTMLDRGKASVGSSKPVDTVAKASAPASVSRTQRPIATP